MNFTKRFFLFGAILLCALTLNSCRRSIGYSVLLWDVPEKNLQDGQILKVYFKSNISRVYVVGIPGTSEKYEVPLWQITEPKSKSKAVATANKYKDYLHQYAHIKVDGLPVRAEAVNTSKQVYRLHKNEIVRILYKGKGQDVIMHDGSKLEGDWLCVLTNGGTQGWCFSHSLALFTTGPGGQIVNGEVQEVESEDSDAIVTQVLQAKWYPESYPKMIEENLIDLESMQSNYGFDTGVESGKVSINIKDRMRSAKYSGITKIRDNVYDFNGTPFQMIIRSADEIVVNYTGPDNKQEAYTFVTISRDNNIENLVQAEQERRLEEMRKLYNVDSFNSSQYGMLSFTGETSFIWSDFDALVPNIIPQEAGHLGNVYIKYLVSKQLQNYFDGVLTFSFDDTDKEVNFFYKYYSNGELVLESMNDDTIKNNIAESRSKQPFELHFNK